MAYLARSGERRVMAALAERAEPAELDAREAAVVLPMPPPDVIHMSPRAGPAGGAAAMRTPIPYRASRRCTSSRISMHSLVSTALTKIRRPE